MSVNGTVITIAYILFASTALRLCNFDTSTDTWSAPGDTTILPDWPATANFPIRFCFVQRSDDTFVIVAAAQFFTYYLTNTAGVWGTATSILPIGGIVCGGVIDTSDRIHLLVTLFTSLGQIDYRQLSSTYVLGGPTTISEMLISGGRSPSIILWSGTTLAIGHLPVTGTGAFTVRVAIGTPLDAPVFADTEVYIVNPAQERAAYVQVTEGSDASLNVFFTNVNIIAATNQIKQGLWNGSAWSVSIYYDAVANPPINGVPGTSSGQVIQSLQGVQLTQGWTVATAMTINDPANPPARVSSGEFLEPAVAPPPEPPPDVPGTISCQIVIGGPPGPGPAGPPRTLRYQIPQRRWFPHTYND